MVDPATIGGFVVAVGKSSLVNTLRDGVVSFLADKTKDIAGDEIKSRIESLRSDAKLNKQIQNALERAAKRWAEDSPDDELVSAVAKSTTFTDLPSIQQVIREIAQNPFSKITAKTLHGGFKDVLPARFEEERIERGVGEFINILQEEFVAIPSLQPTIQTFASLNTANATAVLPHIDNLLEQLLKGPSATEETLQNYLTWVIDQHRYLDPKGTMQTTRQVQVFLDEVYVSLEAEEEEPLSGIDRKFYEDELKAIETREDLKPEEREDFLENLQAKFTKGEERKAPSKPVELAELARKHEKMVILGDPGAGKTTLLRYLALRHAQAKRQFINTTEELGEVFLPVYLRIAEYAENGNGQSLEDFLIANARGREHRDKSLPDLINTSLKNGECIVFLDGLDEVIEPNQRALISAQINSLCHYLGQGGNRFIVASRVAGYRSSPLDGNIPHYRVRDMNLDQIKRFLDQWCDAVERFQTPALAPETQKATAQKEIDSITDAIESNPGVKRLAANPLLLRTLALIHKTGARIPQRRIELYRLAADTLIRDWNLAKGIPQEAMAREADANRLLAELAAWMHENRPAGLATEGDIHQKLCETIAPLRGKETDHPDVETEADDFLDKIRQHTGLFVERAPKRFGFMHLTFEEYFAARWLVARPREASRRIRNKLHRPRWEEPILLAIGFYGMEFPDDVTELIEEAILGKNLGGPSPYEDVLLRDLLFAVRAIGDQDVDVQLCNNLANQFVNLWLDEKGKSKYQSIRIRTQNIMKDIQDSQIGRRVVTIILAALKDEKENVRALAANALAYYANHPEVIPTLLTALNDENEQVRANAVSVLGYATNSPEVVRALLNTFNDGSKLVRSHIAIALGRAASLPEVIDFFLNIVKTGNEELRVNAVSVLEKATKTPEVLSTLLATLKDENDAVSNEAAKALGRSVDFPETATVLYTIFNDASSELRYKIVYACGFGLIFRGNATEIPNVIQIMLAALKDENERVRNIAALAFIFGNFTDSLEVINALLAALSDENEQVRANAAQALSNITDSPEVINALLATLNDENEQVRANAAQALSNITDSPEVINALLATLNDENQQVRANAIRALGNATDSPEVINALLATLNDENQQVRANAIQALGNATDSPEIINILITALNDENEQVRANAIQALGNATDSPEIINMLIIALSDENEKVRANAASAIRERIRYLTSETMQDLPKKLIDALSLPGLENYALEKQGFNLIFDLLNSLAPVPKI